MRGFYYILVPIDSSSLEERSFHSETQGENHDGAGFERSLFWVMLPVVAWCDRVCFPSSAFHEGETVHAQIFSGPKRANLLWKPGVN